MSEFDRNLARLRTRFRERLVDDLAQLRRLAAVAPSRERNLEMIAIAHKISGSAPTFGYPDLGSAAKTLENLLRAEEHTLMATPPGLAELLMKIEQAIDPTR